MKSFLLSATKYGIIMGLGFCLYTILMWLTKLDTVHLSIGQYFDIAIILWPITVIIKSIKYKNESSSISLIERILIAIYIGFISYVIYQPFLYAYHHIINPTWFESVLNLKRSEMELAKVSSEDIISTLDKLKERSKQQDKIYSFATLIPSVFILPFLISLLSLIFIRRKSVSINEMA